MTPDDQLPLPGLEPAGQAAPPRGQLEAATRRTLAALAEAEHIGESDALTCQLMLELSAVVTASVRTGKASAAAMAAAQLLACQELLTARIEETPEADPFAALLAELAANTPTPGRADVGSD